MISKDSRFNGGKIRRALTIADVVDAIKSGDYSVQMLSGETTATNNAFVFNTTATHTTGDVFQLKNNGTERYGFDGNGQLTITPIAGTNGAPKPGLVINSSRTGFFGGTTAMIINAPTGSPFITQNNTGLKINWDSGHASDEAVLLNISGNSTYGLRIANTTTSSGGAESRSIYVTHTGSIGGPQTGVVEVESDVNDFTGNLFKAKYTGADTATAGLFEAENSSGQKFVVNGAGDTLIYGSLVNPRGGFGLVENLVKDSENLTTANWTQAGTITVTENFYAAPDGSLTADRLVGDGTITQDTGVDSTSKTFTLSLYGNFKSTNGATVYIKSDNESEGISLTGFGADKWKFFSVTIAFSGSSTGNVVVEYDGFHATNSDLSVWGVNVSETSKPVVYTPTSNFTIAGGESGGVVNGILHITGNDSSTGLHIHQSRSNSSDLFAVMDDNGVTQQFIDSTFHTNYTDNIQSIYGTGGDSSIYYDNTNLVVDPKLVGSGYLDLLGTLKHQGRIENINTTAKTGAYTVIATDDNILCDTSSGAFTVTLPASPEDGRIYAIILETGGNTLTVSGNGNNIIGSATLEIAAEDDAAVLIYNGTQWSVR